MTFDFRLVLGALALLASSALAPAAFAQASAPVADRQRPEVDPLGVRMGAFLLKPRLGVEERFNDNIFATENNEVDDFITVFNPALDVQSQWSRHALNFGANAKVGRYADNGAEDYEDYNGFVNGTVDIARRSNVSGGISYSKLHEDRGSPDDVNGVNPTEYTLLNANAAFQQRFNRVKLRLSTKLDRYDYDDVTTSGGTTINNDDRDRDEVELGVRVGYEIVPAYEAFVRFTYNDRDYDSATDDNGLIRDSSGYEAVGGVRLDLSGKTFGDVFAGYRSQDYDDPSLNEVSGVSYGASLTWNATSLTTAKLNARRTVEESTQNNASGYLASVFGVSVDHELLRNLLIGGNATYTNNDYEGISREDDITAAGLYAKYLWNRYLDLSVRYDRTSRDSSVAGQDYDKNVLMLRVEGAL